MSETFKDDGGIFEHVEFGSISYMTIELQRNLV